MFCATTAMGRPHHPNPCSDFIQRWTHAYRFDGPRLGRAREGAGASGLSPIERLRHAWRARSNSLGREAGIYIWISDSVYHQLRPHPHRPLRPPTGTNAGKYGPRKMFSRSTRVPMGYSTVRICLVCVQTLQVLPTYQSFCFKCEDAASAGSRI